MRKYLGCFVALALLLSGCVGNAPIVIPQEGYLAAVQALYDDPTAYLGKTVVVEGIFTAYDAEDGSYAMIYRFDADDQPVGFEVTFDGEYPDNFTWVRARGVVDTYEQNGTVFLTLALTSLEGTTAGNIEAD